MKQAIDVKVGNMRKWVTMLLVIILSSMLPVPSHARRAANLEYHKNHHAKTVGQKKFNLTTTWSLEYEDADVTHDITRTHDVDFHLTYGLLEWFDIMVDVPVKYRTVNGKKTYSGLDDITLEAKIKFFEKNGFILALDPFITFPNWGYKYGIGEGRIQSGLTLFGTYSKDPLSVTVSGTYKRNENRVNDRINIWKLYISPSYKVTDPLTLMGSIGWERDTNKLNAKYPLFLSGGFSYQITEMISIIPSIKFALYKPEKDITIYVGTQLVF